MNSQKLGSIEYRNNPNDDALKQLQNQIMKIAASYEVSDYDFDISDIETETINEWNISYITLSDESINVVTGNIVYQWAVNQLEEKAHEEASHRKLEKSIWMFNENYSEKITIDDWNNVEHIWDTVSKISILRPDENRDAAWWLEIVQDNLRDYQGRIDNLAERVKPAKTALYLLREWLISEENLEKFCSNFGVNQESLEWMSDEDRLFSAVDIKTAVIRTKVRQSLKKLRIQKNLNIKKSVENNASPAKQTKSKPTQRIVMKKKKTLIAILSVWVVWAWIINYKPKNWWGYTDQLVWDWYSEVWTHLIDSDDFVPEIQEFYKQRELQLQNVIKQVAKEAYLLNHQSPEIKKELVTLVWKAIDNTMWAQPTLWIHFSLENWSFVYYNVKIIGTSLVMSVPVPKR